MVLDPFGVDLRRIFRNADAAQELQHQKMPLSRAFRDFSALVREKYAAIGLGSHESFAAKPPKRLGYGDMAHPQPLRQIHGARFSRLANERVDELDIVFRFFAAVRLASALESVFRLQDLGIIP